MTVISRDTALTRAAQIRDETALRANSAVRVGSLFYDMIESGLSGTLAQISVTDPPYGAVASNQATAQANSNALAISNTAALQAAVTAASAAGGGVVYIPPGDFWFQHGLLDVNVVCQINGLQRVTIRGGGPGVTRLHLVNGADANFFNFTGAASNIAVWDMELDGNRAAQTPSLVHGIRGDAFSGLWLENLYIHDISHYGIGIEGFVQQYLFFNNIKIENTGGDGFDQKNKSDANLFQCANNITVTNFGLSSGTQAGWDCRGAWQLTNYVCHFSNADGSGIRFRNGETSTPAGGGFGGHRSHVSNIEIYGPGAASSSTGIEAVARDVVVQGAYIRDVLFGISCSFDIPTGFGGERCVFSGVTCENYGTAGFITSSGALRNTFTDCTANGNAVGTYGFRIRSTDCTLNNPKAFGNVSTDISIDTTGTRTHVHSPRLTGSGSPGAAVTGLDVNAADCKCIGGDISGHVTNITVTAARFKAYGVTIRSATTDNVLTAVGGDDAEFIGCTSTGAASEGLQVRAARTTWRGGEITSNGGNGFQSEASASDALLIDPVMSGNTADFDDQGNTTIVTRSRLVGSLVNQAVAAAGTSSNIDIAIPSGATILFRVEAVMEDSTGGTGLRCTQRSLIECWREGSGGLVVGTPASEFTQGAGLTINATNSGNSFRTNVTKAAGTSCRMDIRVWEVRRMKTVVFS